MWHQIPSTSLQRTWCTSHSRGNKIQDSRSLRCNKYMLRGTPSKGTPIQGWKWNTRKGFSEAGERVRGTQTVGGLSKEEARKSVLCFMQNTWYVFYLIVTRFLGCYALLLTTVSQLPRGSMWFWLRFSSQSSNLAWWHGSVCSAVTRDDWQMCRASGHSWRGTV